MFMLQHLLTELKNEFAYSRKGKKRGDMVCLHPRQLSPVFRKSVVFSRGRAASHGRMRLLWETSISETAHLFLCLLRIIFFLDSRWPEMYISIIHYIGGCHESFSC